MPLASGAKLGPYEIVAPIGAGGMGEVYRARDTRLERLVALKILPAHLSSNSDFRERFEREAKTISALQHPNICTLYDIGRQDGIDFLVLELVEGETLDQRLSRSPLPLDQVLRFSAEIADALDKAHRHGIVHRDLKPGNIMLTKSGAKLLDFGLAKLQTDSTALSSALTEVTVETRKLTAEGTLVGTFQYMAPEQLEGKEADARTDIFAFGAVIYEMATGKAAFAGKSRASLIAAILSSEPTPISAVQPMTPPALDRVVKRCLAKDPDDRWQSAGDLASELTWIAEGGSSVAQAGVPAIVTTRRKQRERLAWTAAAVFAVLALIAGFSYFRNRDQVTPSIQAYLPSPDNTTYFFTGDNAGMPVISPDGTRIAFSATDGQGNRLIWIRNLLDGTVRSLQGTDSASFPFWSFDGKMIGFFAAGKLKRVDLNGGLPVDITDANNPRGGTWGQGDVILFAPSSQTPIYRVSASGGEAKPVTQIDTSKHTTHRWPFFLPDGKHFLYLAASHEKPHREFDATYVASIDGKENRFLTISTSNAIAAPGYLIFIQNRSLMAQPFDISSATLSGEPIAIAENIHFEEGNWHGVFDCAPQGTLIYQSAAGTQGSQLAMYARDGGLKKLGDLGQYRDLRLSRDGRKLAVVVGDPGSSLWVYDLARGLRTRLTFGGIGTRSPTWSPDGSQIAFTHAMIGGGPGDIYVIDANRAGSEKLLFAGKNEVEGGERLKLPTDWSPDGKNILFTQTPVGFGVWQLSLSGEPKSQPFLPPQLTTTDAQFSPDGHWVAYTSQESGRTEIYATQFPGATGKWQISSNGARTPRWRRDGKAIFFWAADHTFMEAQVELSSSTLQIVSTHPLFKANMPVDPIGTFTYDVTPDGQHFIVNTTSATGDRPLTLVTNWVENLKRK
jgi:serine/threonine protein kinase/WD40 repeat protein